MADFRPAQQTVTVDGISLAQVQANGSVTNVTPSPTETTVVSATIVTGVFENVTLVSCSGTSYAKFRVKVNGVIRDVRRSAPDYNTAFDWSGAPLSLTAGDVVSVTVEHFQASNHDFEATIYGYA